MASMAENLEQAIRQEGDPLARALGLEILEVQCIGSPTKPLVRLILDKDEGVGIEDCEQFHQSLRRTWEVTHPEGPLYRFEVSSPGLDRPLKDHKDFQRVMGKLVRVILRDALDKNTVVVGRLIALSETGVTLHDNQHRKPQDIALAWENIVKAKVEVEF